MRGSLLNLGQRTLSEMDIGGLQRKFVTRWGSMVSMSGGIWCPRITLGDCRNANHFLELEIGVKALIVIMVRLTRIAMRMVGATRQFFFDAFMVRQFPL